MNNTARLDLDVNGSYTVVTSSNNLRLGLFSGTTHISGTLNADVTSNSQGNSVINYPNFSFGDGDTGVLRLMVNGTKVKEVDLTAGRVDPTSDAVGAIVGPFSQGPVNEPILVQNEQDLLDHFGNPHPIDKHYEHWMVASSYLSYGGPLQVVRSDDTDLKNARSGGAAIKVKSYTDYLNNGYDENIITDTTALARSPGSWANGIKVAIVDAKTDQILTTSSTSGLVVGMGVTESMHGKVLIGTGSTSLADGHLKGIITEVGTTTYGVKVLSHITEAGVETSDIVYSAATIATTKQLWIIKKEADNAVAEKGDKAAKRAFIVDYAASANIGIAASDGTHLFGSALNTAASMTMNGNKELDIQTIASRCYMRLI